MYITSRITLGTMKDHNQSSQNLLCGSQAAPSISDPANVPRGPGQQSEIYQIDYRL